MENNMPLVQVRMKDSTLSQIEGLQNRVHAPSRSDVVRRAIELTDVITKALEHGDKVIIEGKKGKKVQILVPGVIGE
jgi:hypothetical protein